MSKIKNNGPNDILLYPKMKIGRSVFFRLNKPASFQYKEYGKYKDDKTVTKPTFEKEFKTE